jgi:hypothetical protein
LRKGSIWRTKSKRNQNGTSGFGIIKEPAALIDTWLVARSLTAGEVTHFSSTQTNLKAEAISEKTAPKH